MDALIVVDLQNDFMDDGALPVDGAYDVVPLANEAMSRFDIVVATQDWHPPNHGSFADNHEGVQPGEVFELDGLDQVAWPAHCVQGDAGSEFVNGVHTDRFDAVFRKGTDPRVDSYSGFYDNGRRKSTGLTEWLRERGVARVCVLGVATDYCVKFTALDAASEGFATTLLLDGCAGVDMTPGDVDRAVDEMRAAGVSIGSVAELSMR
ncbi:MAG: bifunctional nicotinamidase/pyrazinamidase [Deltaproteobacteria bacterium]|nr:bifunctional nicotinamidase/pyrazinamidase [Deltaproteobacteria bacterium]